MLLYELYTGVVPYSHAYDISPDGQAAVCHWHKHCSSPLFTDALCYLVVVVVVVVVAIVVVACS
jgi:hypothetical protein